RPPRRLNRSRHRADDTTSGGDGLGDEPAGDAGPAQLPDEAVVEDVEAAEHEDDEAVELLGAEPFEQGDDEDERGDVDGEERPPPLAGADHRTERAPGTVV